MISESDVDSFPLLGKEGLIDVMQAFLSVAQRSTAE